MVIGTLQIGKEGISYNFHKAVENMFKNHHLVKISVLRSARGEGKEGKETVKKYAEEIREKLGAKYTTKVIGFKIIVKKWRKARTEDL
jgi:RNA-binding protein YhbY